MEAGPADLSVRELVERAGTSVGAFYTRFDDRDAALAYASHDFWSRSRQLWSDYLEPQRWEGASAARIVATVVRTFGRTMQADRQRIRAFGRLSLSLAGGGVAMRIAEHDRFIAGAMAGLLDTRPGEIRHPEPHYAAEEGFRRVLGAVRDGVVFGEGDRDPAADRRSILALCQMYGRFLDVHPVPSKWGELLRMTHV